ncbi:DsbA family protein [Candidatus Woesearchaeota archaeon]|nr:DsbA family protein [Candidatus Woesearchaeota archaeon]
MDPDFRNNSSDDTPKTFEPKEQPRPFAPNAEERRFEPKEEESKKDKKSDSAWMWKLATAVLAILLIASIFTNGFSFSPTGGAVDVIADDDTDNSGSAVAGDVVKIEVYSEFQCPFCGRFTPTLEQIKDEYGDKVSIEFKHFPLSFHQYAQKASEAAECARDQDKFWEMHDKMFDNQDALDVASLEKYAEELGLDVDAFKGCLESGEKAATVKADFDEGQKKGVSGTPTIFVNDLKLVGARPFDYFQGAIDAELAGEDWVDPAAQPAEPEPTGPADIKLSGKDASKGPDNAPVLIVEFSDFQCPFCSRGRTTMDQVVEEYGDKVQLVFKHFPLSFHENAQKAAEAAECALDQDKFWEMHDIMFDNQGALTVDDLKGYAEELELDIDAFNDCLDSGEKEAKVSADMAEGQKYGVSGTPAFFINGNLVSGAQPFENFKAAIDAELESAGDTQDSEVADIEETEDEETDTEEESA